jgi:hypothetical protein
MSRLPDNTSPAVPASDDIISEAVLQVHSATNTAVSNTLSSMNGVNGCSTPVCNDVNSINPLPLLFKALLHGQKDCVFFSRHLIYILKQKRFRAVRPAGGV